MASLQLPAPAKINRFLHITGQRQDGYHTLQTIFQFIDLMDQIEFKRISSREIILQSQLQGITATENLITRAAKLLQQFTDCSQGVEIVLHKNIPVGGGLGGGSSDAATTLLALNALWQLNLTKAQLIEIGVSLGADIPIFIHGHSAWAEGIGDQLTSIEVPESWLVLVAPNVSVATAEIFFDKALSRRTPACKMSPSLADSGHNDCEPVVRDRYPEVARALDWLNQFAPARLTGTGGCLFAVVATQQEANAIVKQMPKNYNGFAVRTLNQSPVEAILRNY